MVGRKYEAGGIAKDGAKMVTAVATAQARGSPCMPDCPLPLHVCASCLHISPTARTSL